MFMDATNEKMTAPVQVSFLNIRAFVHDVEVNSQEAHPFPGLGLTFYFFLVKSSFCKNIYFSPFILRK